MAKFFLFNVDKAAQKNKANSRGKSLLNKLGHFRIYYTHCMTKEQETFSSGNNASNPEWAGKAHLDWARVDSRGTKNSLHHTLMPTR